MYVFPSISRFTVPASKQLSTLTDTLTSTPEVIFNRAEEADTQENRDLFSYIEFSLSTPKKLKFTSLAKDNNGIYITNYIRLFKRVGSDFYKVYEFSGYHLGTTLSGTQSKQYEIKDESYILNNGTYRLAYEGYFTQQQPTESVYNLTTQSLSTTFIQTQTGAEPAFNIETQPGQPIYGFPLSARRLELIDYTPKIFVFDSYPNLERGKEYTGPRKISIPQSSSWKVLEVQSYLNLQVDVYEDNKHVYNLNPTDLYLYRRAHGLSSTTFLNYYSDIEVPYNVKGIFTNRNNVESRVFILFPGVDYKLVCIGDRYRVNTLPIFREEEVKL